MTEENPLHKQAKEIVKLLQENAQALLAGQPLSLVVYQPDPNEQEYHAMIVTHVVVGSTPARAVDLLHRVLTGTLPEPSR